MVKKHEAGAFVLVLMLMLESMCTARLQAQDAVAANPPAVPTPSVAAPLLPHERTLSLRHHWTGEELTIVYRVGSGYQAEALAQLNWLLRDYRCNLYTQIDPKLFDLLYELQQELKPRGPIRIVSAYRSEGYNASLLRAGRTVDPDSQHTLGRAVDVLFPGVPAERVRAAAEAKGLGGVGYYPFSGPVFVHVDTGPLRHWAERDPKVSRAMGVPARRRSRLALDCTLTTERVLGQISAQEAYAALPPGAASKPHPAGDLMQTALASTPAFRALGSPTDIKAATSADLHDADGPACTGSDPRSSFSPQPSKLLRLDKPSLRKSAPAKLQAKEQFRQKAKLQVKQKAKRRIQVARLRAALVKRTPIWTRGQ